MTKILAFHVRDDEQEFIDQWSKEHQIQVDSIPLPIELHDNNIEKVKGYDGLIYKQRSVLSNNESFYQKLHEYGIQQIATRSVGIDTINLEFAKKNHIRVTNVPSYSPEAVAEMALTQAMQLVRHIPQLSARLRDNNYFIEGLRSRELTELTVGIIGVGRIGGTLARIFHLLGATVIGNDIRPPREDMRGVLTYVSKEELYKRADIISIHVWGGADNAHLIGKDQFAQFKPSAFFINDSRGFVVDTDALVTALKEKQLAAAAIDVVEKETSIFNHSFDGDETPVPAYNELKKMPNVLLTPHSAFFTDHAVKNMVMQALDDTLTIIQGGVSPHEIQ
ncbi:D-2-hydroxyacid dehydrogenase [Secundilactobacillus folii]|uniref:D-2-hydroxyacid dehydrogenase n=1 Tax=Secundilactobacillus folii TaxID=2678357 RepID=A0A7X2XV41_9LACO|nr:D-2-hydroxyacid dehydrogenase [Secundilactobacillus folii]MTV81625.1 D-2-hydroxyacid dehydrogenase [Secundilactobacillus folii]